MNVCKIVFCSNHRFGRGTQEDSHEVLRCLLSGLREEQINVSHENLMLFLVQIKKVL